MEISGPPNHSVGAALCAAQVQRMQELLRHGAARLMAAGVRRRTA